MPAVSKDQALDLLTKEIENLPADELLEVCTELFPENPHPEKDGNDDPTLLARRLVNRLRSGLEIDELVDLWSLIFPKHRNVWYDEEEQRIHYKAAEPMHAE